MEKRPQETSAFYETLQARGLSRRDFLRFCGSVAVTAGLTQAAAPQIAEALALAGSSPMKPALWLSQGLCTGCTESVAQSAYPDAARIVLEILSVNYWETLSAGAGQSVEDAVAKTVTEQRGRFILIVEGALMTGFDGNALRVAGRPAIDDFKAVADAAEAVVAVGSCAVDGGWVKASPNPAGGVGVMDVIGKSKVVNLPTCPVNPEWVVAVLVDYLVLGKLPVLDAQRRPTSLFGQTVHDNCPRRGHFENDEFVESFGTSEEARNFCLYKMGCKGPQTLSQCPIVRWNSRVSWCVESGSPCIGCANFAWVDKNTPFLEHLPSGTGVSPETIGVVAGGAALAGLVAHGIAQTRSGRLGTGAPVESVEDADGVRAHDDTARTEAPSGKQADDSPLLDEDALDWTIDERVGAAGSDAEEDRHSDPESDDDLVRAAEPDDVGKDAAADALKLDGEPAEQDVRDSADAEELAGDDELELDFGARPADTDDEPDTAAEPPDHTHDAGYSGRHRSTRESSLDDPWGSDFFGGGGTT